MKSKLLTILLTGAMICALTVNAQTDCTSLITNPSFETGTDGWEERGEMRSYYNLNGQRMNAAPQKKGVYIVNRKKVILE